MGEEERRQACSYLEFFYRFFKSELSGSPGGEGGIEFKVENLEAQLEELINRDETRVRLLEAYRRLFEYRKKATLQVKESLNVLRAVCNGALNANIKLVFYEHAKNHLQEALTISEKIFSILNELDKTENRQLLEELKEHIKENNAGIKNKLKEAKLFLENALQELEKLKPD